MFDIYVSVVVIVDVVQCVLVVCKEGMICFMQFGGKLEFGEFVVQILICEFEEEFGLVFCEGDLCFLGIFVLVVVNEFGYCVVVEVFVIMIDFDVVIVQVEFVELCWIILVDVVMLFFVLLSVEYLFLIVWFVFVG